MSDTPPPPCSLCGGAGWVPNRIGSGVMLAVGLGLLATGGFILKLIWTGRLQPTPRVSGGWVSALALGCAWCVASRGFQRRTCVCRRRQEDDDDAPPAAGGVH